MGLWEQGDVRVPMRDTARAYFRRQVELYGLNVECLVQGVEGPDDPASCGWRGKHRPEREGRLRFKRCPRCGLRSVRASAWVGRYPSRAEKLRAEHRAGEGVFT